MSAPLSSGAAIAMGAVVMSPLAGAAVALHQHSWEPLGYGAVAAAAVFVAFAVGAAVAQARQARRIVLSPENEVHPDRAAHLESACEEIDRQAEEIEELLAERDRLRAERCWKCGASGASISSSVDNGASWQPVVRRGSESGERATDVTSATESPGPATGGA